MRESIKNQPKNQPTGAAGFEPATSRLTVERSAN